MEDNQIQKEIDFLASCMAADFFQDAIRDAKKVLEYFIEEKHRIIYDVLLDIDNSGHSLDPVVLVRECEKRGLLASFVTSIYSKSVSGVHLKYHHKVIKDAFLRRRINSMIDYTKKISSDLNRPANEILRELSDRVIKLQEVTIEGETKHIDTAVEEAYNLIADKMYNPGGIVGIPCGIDALDNITRGYEGSRVYLIAGRPGNGKTTLAVQIASNISINKKVVFFSMEMPRKELVAKVIQSAARIDLKVKTKDEKDANIERIKDVLQDVIDKNFYVNDSYYQTIDSICTETRRMHRKGLCDFVMIDHATLPQLEGLKVKEMLSKLGKALKGLAKECDIPVLFLAQFNRLPEVEKRMGRMSDLGESGTLEQDIDCAQMLHNLNYDDPYNLKMQLGIPKNRGGELANLAMKFEKKYQLFEERPRDEGE